MQEKCWIGASTVVMDGGIPQAPTTHYKWGQVRVTPETTRHPIIMPNEPPPPPFFRPIRASCSKWNIIKREKIEEKKLIIRKNE